MTLENAIRAAPRSQDVCFSFVCVYLKYAEGLESPYQT